MPIPFAPMPTLDEFVAKACDSGCKRHLFPATLIGPKGEVSPPKCLVGPRGIPIVMPDIAGSDRLTPRVFEGLCRQLGLDPEIFLPPKFLN